MTETQKVWSIDFCADNLRDITSTTEAVCLLKEALIGYKVNYTTQSCIHACRPCHEGALIVRLEDQLITAATSEEVVKSVIAKIKAMD